VLIHQQAGFDRMPMIQLVLNATVTAAHELWLPLQSGEKIEEFGQNRAVATVSRMATPKTTRHAHTDFFRRMRKLPSQLDSMENAFYDTNAYGPKVGSRN